MTITGHFCLNLVRDGMEWEWAVHGHTPRRAEPLYQIGMYHARQKQWARAWLFLEAAAARKEPDDLLLFIERDAYGWQTAMEAAVAAYWIGEHEKAAALNHALLNGDALPKQYRKTVERNLSLSATAIGENARGDDMRHSG